MEREIIERAALLVGDVERAENWYRSVALVGFNGKTAAEMVWAGQAYAVLKHLETMALGGFAYDRSSNYGMGSPKGFMSFSSTVFGNSPDPQRMKDPKSLYQSPSGATGFVRVHACNAIRSDSEIRRSSTRSSR